jgi:hypothetical protein
MKYILKNINSKEIFFQKLWAVALFFSFFTSSGFVGSTLIEQPRPTQTEWVIAKRPLSISIGQTGKKAFFYQSFCKTKKRYNLFKTYKNLVKRHTKETLCVLDNCRNKVLSFKELPTFLYQNNASRNIQEDAIMA